MDDLPEAIDQADSASLGGSPAGGLNSLLKYGSLVSLAVDDLTDMTLDEILSGYHLLLTSTERSQHDICACIERATRTLLQSSEHKDIFTPIPSVALLDESGPVSVVWLVDVPPSVLPDQIHSSIH